jgi:hypothetical protein
MLRSLQPKMFALALATCSPFVIGSEASANLTNTCREFEPEAAPISPESTLHPLQARSRAAIGLSPVTGSEASANLEPEAAPRPKLPPVQTRQPPPIEARYRVVDDKYLNVREGASANYQLVGVIPPAATGVTIDDYCVRKWWCHITWRTVSSTVSGWVNARHLRPEKEIPLPRLLRGTRP